MSLYFHQVQDVSRSFRMFEACSMQAKANLNKATEQSNSNLVDIFEQCHSTYQTFKTKAKSLLEYIESNPSSDADQNFRVHLCISNLLKGCKVIHQRQKQESQELVRPFDFNGTGPLTAQNLRSIILFKSHFLNQIDEKVTEQPGEREEIKQRYLRNKETLQSTHADQIAKAQQEGKSSKFIKSLKKDHKQAEKELRSQRRKALNKHDKEIKHLSTGIQVMTNVLDRALSGEFKTCEEVAETFKAAGESFDKFLESEIDSFDEFLTAEQIKEFYPGDKGPLTQEKLQKIALLKDRMEKEFTEVNSQISEEKNAMEQSHQKAIKKLNKKHASKLQPLQEQLKKAKENSSKFKSISKSIATLKEKHNQDKKQLEKEHLNKLLHHDKMTQQMPAMFEGMIGILTEALKKDSQFKSCEEVHQALEALQASFEPDGPN